MPSAVVEKIGILTQLAEMKRIYSVAMGAMFGSSPISLLVTSAARGEGKTFLLAGLAVAAASFSGKRVLAVDMNWYAPTLHTCFGLDLVFESHNIGSSTSFLDSAQPTTIPHLSILAAPRSVQESAATMGDLYLLGIKVIQEALTGYDLVLVDTCSVFPTNRYMMDPVALAKNVSGVLLIVRNHVTPRQTVKRAYTTLAMAGANLLGAVANQWKDKLP